MDREKNPKRSPQPPPIVLGRLDALPDWTEIVCNSTLGERRRQDAALALVYLTSGILFSDGAGI